MSHLYILRSFVPFLRFNPVKLGLLFLLTLFLGFNQGITIVLLIPLLELLNPQQTPSPQNKISELLRTFNNSLGLTISLELILFVFAFALVALAILNFYQTTLQNSYQQEFSYYFRKKLFKKILCSEWSIINGKSKHDQLQVLTTEIPKMTNYYYFYLGLATKVILISIHLALAMLISLHFTLFLIFIGSAIFLSLRNYLKKAKILGDANIQSFRKMLKHIDDFWLTIKMAKVHSTEAFNFRKFEQSNCQILACQNQQVRNRAIPQFLFSLAGIFSLILFVYLAYGIAKMPIPSLFVLILLFARIFPQLMGTNNDINMLFSNVESVKMVMKLDGELINESFEEKKNSDSIPFNNQLEIRNLTFNYVPEIPLFNNVSFLVPVNRITGILGKSGSGKTTLIDILAGLQYPQTGEIYVDGKILTKEKMAVWRSGLGYLPQDSFFIDGTIRENLIWDADSSFSDESIMEILKSVNADQLVLNQKDGLNTTIVNYQYHFSGGERQRLALARVLLRQPRLLLLDEATSALDAENESQIMQSLMLLKQHITILFITHRSSLKPYFDTIIDLD